VRRGGSYGGGYGGGSSGGVHVLIAGNGGHGYGSPGAPSHVLNAGGGLGFIPSSYGAQQRWYYDIALRSGDPYAAKAIGGGNYAIQTADAAAVSAAHGVVAQANDPNIANTVAYLTHHADAALLDAAAHRGAAWVVQNAASYH
ncbi:hypothetical protein Pcinc_044250, partial [Petrolisthes cinctipes]